MKTYNLLLQNNYSTYLSISITLTIENIKISTNIKSSPPLSSRLTEEGSDTSTARLMTSRSLNKQFVSSYLHNIEYNNLETYVKEYCNNYDILYSNLLIDHILTLIINSINNDRPNLSITYNTILELYNKSNLENNINKVDNLEEVKSQNNESLHIRKLSNDKNLSLGSSESSHIIQSSIEQPNVIKQTSIEQPNDIKQTSIEQPSIIKQTSIEQPSIIKQTSTTSISDIKEKPSNVMIPERVVKKMFSTLKKSSIDLDNDDKKNDDLSIPPPQFDRADTKIEPALKGFASKEKSEDFVERDSVNDKPDAEYIELIKNMKTAMAVRKVADKWKQKKVRIIEEAHSFFGLTVSMMLGISTMAKKHNNMNAHHLEDKDMKTVDKLNFPAGGSGETPKHNLSDFEFKDYAGATFHEIRKHFGIKTSSYLASLASNLPYIDFISNSKSGAFFFYSNDRRYMIKTQPKDEAIFLREKFLWPYFQHVLSNPETLLCRIYGIHRVTVNGNKYHFIIMGNVFNTELNIHKRFDLKGSHYGRSAKPHELQQLCPILKDNDFNDARLNLGEFKKRFMEQLTSDARFLASLNIMDYSLLVGIHNIKQERDAMKEFGLGIFDTCTIANNTGLISKGSMKDIALKLMATQSARSRFSTIARPRSGQSYYGLDKHNVPFNMSEAEGSESKPQLETAQTLMNQLLNEKPPSSSPISANYVQGFNTYYGGLLSYNSEEVYFCGVIDILTDYGVKKKAESFFKSLVISKNELSAVNPEFYTERFLKYFDDHII